MQPHDSPRPCVRTGRGLRVDTFLSCPALHSSGPVYTDCSQDIGLVQDTSHEVRCSRSRKGLCAVVLAAVGPVADRLHQKGRYTPPECGAVGTDALHLATQSGWEPAHESIAELEVVH